MKMPEKIDTIMFAPCGMNCKLCIKHLSENNPCPGCLIDSPNKTKKALKCKIKKCLETKRVKYCGRCSEFPCNKIMLEDSINWKCESCGGIISIQEHVCSECGLKDDGK